MHGGRCSKGRNTGGSALPLYPQGMGPVDIRAASTLLMPSSGWWDYFRGRCRQSAGCRHWWNRRRTRSCRCIIARRERRTDRDRISALSGGRDSCRLSRGARTNAARGHDHQPSIQSTRWTQPGDRLRRCGHGAKCANSRAIPCAARAQRSHAGGCTQGRDVQRMQAWAGQSAGLASARPAGDVTSHLWAGALELLGN